MTQHLLTVNGGGLSGNDDDGGSTSNARSLTNYKKLLSVHKPSVDSNTNEDDASDVGTKVTKRKSRQTVQAENYDTYKRIIKKTPWYRKFDLSKPLKILALLLLIYLMWKKQDIWVPRLLTSNNRVRFASEAIKGDRKSSDSSTITTTTSSNSLDREDTIENIDEKNDLGNNNEDLISPSSSSSKSSGSQKAHIRIRRNKMSFNQDRRKKKNSQSQDLPIDGGGQDDGEEEEEEDDDEGEDKSISKEESLIPSETNATKKSSSRSKNGNKKSEILVPLKSSLSLSTYNDILEQLRKNLRLRSRDPNFFSTLTKRTGLNKNRLYRFIYKKEYQLMTLQTFMVFLDTFNLKLLVVPK